MIIGKMGSPAGARATLSHELARPVLTTLRVVELGRHWCCAACLERMTEANGPLRPQCSISVGNDDPHEAAFRVTSRRLALNYRGGSAR